jgi:ribosomal protein S18 acetylase RimI-like enzyme
MFCHDRDAMTEVEILAAELSDAEEILAVQRLAFHAQAVLHNDFTIPPIKQTLYELKSDFNRFVFLKAAIEGRMVGSVKARMENDTCFISRLIVLPECQNLGIGKMLMTAIENQFPEARRFEIFTGSLSSKNLAFYKNIGYKPFREGTEAEHVKLIFMEKISL